MEKLDAIKALRKKKQPEKSRKIGVTYTRVSTKEQADNNSSLETQLELCTKKAIERDISIVEDFGKTYESAKSDLGRKEFQRMLKFIKSRRNTSNAVDYIIVYSLDRFSRTGASGMNIIEDLFNSGVQVISVKDGSIDYTQPIGKVYSGLKMLFSQLDNAVRAEKCTDGTRSMLRKGGWPTLPPIGYSKTIKINGLMKSTINEKGKLIKIAFQMKIYQNKTNTEIQKFLHSNGLPLLRQKLTDIFKNPFYCGLISHNALDYEPVQGIQDAMITLDEFLQINELNKKYLKSSHLKEDDSFPLKSSVRCIKCNRPLTGYHVKGKKAKYYKCNTISCKVNVNNERLNLLFIDLLKNFEIPSSLNDVIKNHLQRVFERQNKLQYEKEKQILKSLEEKTKAMEKVTMRHALGEIEPEVYKEVRPVILEEIARLESELIKAQASLSNLEMFIDFSLNLCKNLHSCWIKASFQTKQRLQHLMFPEGLLYDKVLHVYRTLSVNDFFNLTNSLSMDLAINEKGQIGVSTNLSCSVAPSRIELLSKV